MLQPGFLRLPLELRQSIYQNCCATTPTPSLLCINRLIHDEATHFIRTRLHTFHFHISATEGAGFDALARWCFKVKGHRGGGEKNRMKQLILNIYPPNRDKPIQIFQIWDHILDFCNDLATYPRIPGLKVVFAESENARWVTKDGIVNASFGLQEYFHKENFRRHDISQILLAFSHLVKNVRRPAIVLPSSSEEEMQNEVLGVEQLMMGKWHCKSIRTEYEHLEDVIDMQRHDIPYRTGLASKAVFERIFGQEATLDCQSFEGFEREWPYMHILPLGKRPRYRRFRCRSWYCGCQESFVEVSMPPPTGGLDEERWYDEEWIERDYGPCPLGRAHCYPPGQASG